MLAARAVCKKNALHSKCSVGNKKLQWVATAAAAAATIPEVRVLINGTWDEAANITPAAKHMRENVWKAWRCLYCWEANLADAVIRGESKNTSDLVH